MPRIEYRVTVLLEAVPVDDEGERIMDEIPDELDSYVLRGCADESEARTLFYQVTEPFGN